MARRGPYRFIMKSLKICFALRFGLLAAVIVAAAAISIAQTSAGIKLELDATEAARNVLHVKESIAVRPGQFTLFYPKWIPGEHAPTGPINDMVNLVIKGNGKTIAWDRDDVEMFAFHLTIPAGVRQIEVSFDDVSQPSTVASSELSRIKWNRVLVYPRGTASDTVMVTASMKLPSDWKYAAALTVAKESANTVSFKPVSLTAFIDSPAIIGRYFKKVDLTQNGVLHEIDIVADTPEALNYKPETLEGWKNLVKEANLMYGAHHYNSYRFLLTLSNIGGSEGLEHHESSEDGVGLNSFSNDEELYDLGDLLGHEYTHSWNGKYRRPASLTTPDFEQPMHGDLLWVYEGLTEYLGNVLPARSHLWTPEIFRETVATVGAMMEYQSGRKWRPLVDTARAVQFTYPSPNAWMNARRRVDYYYEGLLIWMEADVLIRQKSGGRKSLDDFLHEFHGGQSTGPMVRTYNFVDVVTALNKVLPNDWAGFLRQRIYTVQKGAPLGGITNGGWKLVYNDTPNMRTEGNEKLKKYRNFMYSIGITVSADGAITDVNPDMEAAKAGLAPGMTILRDDGKEFSLDDLAKTVADSKGGNSPIKISAQNGADKQTYSINYHGGARHPHLVRDESKKDILSEVIKGH